MSSQLARTSKATFDRIFCYRLWTSKDVHNLDILGLIVFFIFCLTVLHTMIPKRLLVQSFLDNTYPLKIFNQGDFKYFAVM